ncbi:TetR/AcrR family transcriptional regulator [Planococcus soli]|uniref:TetR/AcrR family transcriptional regulator n=1 Tax=Planococcus soli TaxID=2666072 RepID=UPI00115D4F06|nr:TetR/AcrR family transcriptional regulator [Planococcus soli]
MSSKKEDLLVTAERLFYSHGFHAIGLKAIVQEAGVALMTLYNHFNSKEELILEILNRREQAYFDLLEQAKQNETGSIENRLAAGHLIWLKNSSSNGCMFLRAKEEFGNAPDQLIVQKVYSHKEKMLQFFQSNGLSPSVALQLSLLFEGATSLSETMDIEKIEYSLIPLVQQL